jgi:peptidyl-prolyl cis-trans isomerase C
MAVTKFCAETVVFTLGVLAFAALACRSSGRSPRETRATDSSEVVAKVDDAVITVGDLQALINKQPAFVRVRYTDPARRRQFVDELVQNEVLAAAAARRGYDKDPDVQWAVKQQMVAKLVRKDFESKQKVEDVPDTEVETYYKGHPAEFRQKDAVGVNAIFTKNKAKADRAYAQAQALPKGSASLEEQQERFRSLATKSSDVPVPKSLAGDLLFFSEDSAVVPPPIVGAAFKLKVVGDLAPPIKTEQGWAIILLTQKRSGFNRPLIAVKRQIQQILFRDMRSKALDAFVDDLRRKRNITTNEANLSKVVVEAGAADPGFTLPGPLGPPINAPPPGTSAGAP